MIALLTQVTSLFGPLVTVLTLINTWNFSEIWLSIIINDYQGLFELLIMINNKIPSTLYHLGAPPLKKGKT